jgi:hypothetical protein
MGMINSANWTWPGSQPGPHNGLCPIPLTSRPDVRALYVVGKPASYLQGDTFNEALTWFNRQHRSSWRPSSRDRNRRTAAREAINTAANLRRLTPSLRMV